MLCSFLYKRFIDTYFLLKQQTPTYNAQASKVDYQTIEIKTKQKTQQNPKGTKHFQNQISFMLQNPQKQQCDLFSFFSFKTKKVASLLLTLL